MFIYRISLLIAVWISCLGFVPTYKNKPLLADSPLGFPQTQEENSTEGTTTPQDTTGSQQKPKTDNLKSAPQKNNLFLIVGLAAGVIGLGGGIYFILSRPKPTKNPPPQQYSPVHDVVSDIRLDREQPRENNLDYYNFSTTNLEQDLDYFEINRKNTRISKVNFIEQLIDDLQMPDPDIRKNAIWQLAQQGDSRAIQSLVQLMLDTNSQERSLILAAISQIAIRTIKPLNQALAISLQDDNAEVRKNAVRDLTKVYESISKVSKRLQFAVEDSDQEVREIAQWSLEALKMNRNRLSPSQSEDYQDLEIPQDNKNLENNLYEDIS